MATSSDSKFECTLCNYFTPRLSQYNRHLMTSKHKMKTISSQIGLEVENNIIFTCNICNKQYKNRSGLWRHNKVCNIIKNEATNEAINNSLDDTKILIDDTKILIATMKDLLHTYQEERTKILELVGKITNKLSSLS